MDDLTGCDVKLYCGISMGLPSTALYIVVAVTVSPILIKAGDAFSSAFLCLLVWRVIQYYSSGRPSDYTAASIARADPMQTSWDAVRLALPGFIIPFILVYNPALLMQGDNLSVISIGLMVIMH